MQFIEERIIKNACYSLKGYGSECFYINSSAFFIENTQGEIKKYSVPNSSHFCFCESSSVIALLDTSGQLFIIDTQADTLIKIPVCNSGEGCAPIFFQNSVYWADWGGKIFKCNLSAPEPEVIVDLSEQDTMIENLDISESRNELIATLYGKKDKCHYLLCKQLDEYGYKIIKLPFKKRCDILGVNYFEDKIILYEIKSKSVYIFELIEDKLTAFKTISVPEKYDSFDGNLCVSGNLCALQSRNQAAVMDIDKEEIVFVLNENYISDISLSENKLYVGCWDKGFSFLISEQKE